MKLRYLVISCTFFSFFNLAALDHYYCTPADKEHFIYLKNLIGSIHKNDFEHLGEIAVFDLGFTSEQIVELRHMQRVKVYNVEMTHPDLLKPMLTSPGGRKVRGFFAWKPVIIKQVLEMFPYVLYLDAGNGVLKPLDELFEYINEYGYLLLSTGCQETHKFGNRVTKPVCDKILNYLSAEKRERLMLQVYQITAGVQGLSRDLFSSYVVPVYEHTRDMTLFADDGTAKLGYGEGRHDQTLFTIYAYILGLKINPMGPTVLDVAGKSIPISIAWTRSMIDKNTVIFFSRDSMNFNGGTTKFVKYC